MNTWMILYDIYTTTYSDHSEGKSYHMSQKLGTSDLFLFVFKILRRMAKITSFRFPSSILMPKLGFCYNLLGSTPSVAPTCQCILHPPLIWTRSSSRASMRPCDIRLREMRPSSFCLGMKIAVLLIMFRLQLTFLLATV